MGYSETTMRVIEKIASNQLKEQEQENYPRNLAREISISRSTLNSRLNFLEDIGVVSKVRKGQKKIVRLNSEVVQKVRKS